MISTVKKPVGWYFQKEEHCCRSSPAEKCAEGSSVKHKLCWNSSLCVCVHGTGLWPLGEGEAPSHFFMTLLWPVTLEGGALGLEACTAGLLEICLGLFSHWSSLHYLTVNGD